MIYHKKVGKRYFFITFYINIEKNVFIMIKKTPKFIYFSSKYKM